MDSQDFERILDEKLKPICDELKGFKVTLFGPEGRTGLVADVTKARDLAKKHETMLRGRDGTSGLVKKINYLWGIALTGAVGLFWKAWDFLTDHHLN